MSAAEAASLASMVRHLEDRFWQAEQNWAKTGSGMTKEQQTGAAMAFSFIRETLRREAIAPPEPDNPA